MRAKGKASKGDKWKANYKEPEELDLTKLQGLPGGWIKLRFKDISTFKNGINFTSSQKGNTGYLNN